MGRLDEIIRARNRESEARKKWMARNHRERLLIILRKKLSRIFIGDISLMEKFFGELWGHGKTDDQRTPEELWWLRKWQALRTEILNNGNSQLRAVEQEVALHEVSWQRHQKTFLLNEEKKVLNDSQ